MTESTGLYKNPVLPRFRNVIVPLASNGYPTGTRVVCLYRVSTDKQLYYTDGNHVDIPMQRIRCREYAAANGWNIVCELQEEGISGYKIRAENRDKIQLIKEYALGRKFDILLVFMFDRIGRIADETPFVVEWLVRNGIRVVSVTEGEQKFESHTDLLLNYIRFWQADGESRKTSIRTANSLHILTEQGYFTGGTCPYGYSFVKAGRTNKKKQEVNDLAICESEAMIVRLMFSLAANEGYGAQRIANYLHKAGIQNRSGINWHPATIRGILRNILYTGILRSGDIQAPPLPHLQIVDSDLFERVQKLSHARSVQNAKDRNVPLTTKSPSLLSGFLFCGECGAHLQVSTSRKGCRKSDGTVIIRNRYICPTKRTLHEKCTGQTTYQMERVDRYVENQVLDIFLKVKRLSRRDVVTKYIQTKAEQSDAAIHHCQCTLDTVEQDCLALREEIIKSISGSIAFSPEMLETVLRSKEQEWEEARIALQEAKLMRAQVEEDSITFSRQFDELLDWAMKYPHCTIDAKHMILSNLIVRIDIYRDYYFHIKLADNVMQLYRNITE